MPGIISQHCCLHQTSQCVLDGVSGHLAHKTSGLTLLCFRTECQPLVVPQFLHLVTILPLFTVLQMRIHTEVESTAFFFNHQKLIILFTWYLHRHCHPALSGFLWGAPNSRCQIPIKWVIYPFAHLMILWYWEQACGSIMSPSGCLSQAPKRDTRESVKSCS